MVNYLALLISTVILVLIAFACEYSGPYLSLVLASAPTGAPLALYYATTSNTAASAASSLSSATDGLLRGASSTLAFAIAARQAARQGYTLYPTLLIAYIAWSAAYWFLAQLKFDEVTQHVSEIRPTR